MTSYLFIFGRSPELAYQELSAVSLIPPKFLTDDVACIEDMTGIIDTQSWIHRLGGIVKIARKLGESTVLTPNYLVEHLEGTPGETLVFGVSLYGTSGLVDSNFLREMKELLARKNIRSRFVMPHEGDTLSSVVVTKQKVSEVVVVYAGGVYIIGQTQNVQDFEAWNMRDYGRPYADPKSGMLPPKTARMAVNVAKQSKVESRKSKVLLDPFCGMGTIVGEALFVGWNTIGSDQSEDVVQKAKKNIEWVTGLNPVRKQDLTTTHLQFIVSDATHISVHVARESVDAIVTEPFMGRNDQQPMTIDQAKNRIKGLEKLYIGCLKEWLKILKSEGSVVIALPEYHVSGRIFFVKNVIDRCETLGYTVSAGPLSYSRPQAVVRRQFYIFQRIT
ncbi:methyltransferase domain-containing protein [Candidatus Gottesmanbacteria bacterium]|nr:methyltransferase domain-containing protein [Candidatus Gottesmanbacteria bacterium]